MSVLHGPAASDAPLTILLPYDGAHFGGSYVSSLALASGLAELGHHPIVMALGPGLVVEAARERGLTVVEAAALPTPQWVPGLARYYLPAPRILRMLSDLRPDIVHVNDLAMLRAWSGPARLAGRPLLKHWRSNYARSATVNAGLAMADAVVAISRKSAGDLPPWAQKKTSIEYNPFEPPISTINKGSAREQLRLFLRAPPDAAVIGVFANITKRKRSHMLADILAALPATADGRPIYGAVFGAPLEPVDDELHRKIMDMGLEGRLSLPGFLRPVEPFMAGCDLVFCPAVREPFGRTVFEALAAGTPSVIADDAGATELLANGGALIVPAQGMKGWMAAVQSLLNDSAAAASVVAEGRKVLDTLSPLNHARRIERHYRRLLERRGRL